MRTIKYPFLSEKDRVNKSKETTFRECEIYRSDGIVLGQCISITQEFSRGGYHIAPTVPF